MDAKEKSSKLMTVLRVILTALAVTAIVLSLLDCYTSLELSFTALLFVMISVFVFICYMFAFLNANESNADSDHAAIEHKYKIGNFVVVASVSLIVIYILSHVVATLVDFDASDENVANFYTAFIALCTTFVVGFQIYNSLDLNKKIDKLDADKKSLEEELKKLKKVTKESEYFNAYTIGTIRYRDSRLRTRSFRGNKKYCWNALRAYFNALRLAAEGGHDFYDTLNALYGKIETCIEELKNYGNKNTGPNKYIYDDVVVKDFVETISDFIKKTESTFSKAENVITQCPKDFKLLVKMWESLQSDVLKSIK